MPINKITLTGVDESTDIERLIQMTTDHPFVEFGFLYTTTPEGRNRYPSFDWLAGVLPRLNGRAALHICGKQARIQLGISRLTELTRHTPRVQVNGILAVDEAEMLATRSGVQTLISQHTHKNSPLLTVKATNHCILIDDSGGRGISPNIWNPPQTSKYVGFAGGLGPDNLAAELTKIQTIAGTGSWVDMEGKLRTHDFFDLDKAEACINIFRECW
jgi:hypothetical protein